MSKATATRARPLSPHLTVYRWPITMTMSIVHRITGGALYFGTLLVAWWLIAAATSESYFDFVNGDLRLVDRPAGAVRLHLGAGPPHARRHPPSDLGHRRRAGEAHGLEDRLGDARRLGRADAADLDRRLHGAGSSDDGRHAHAARQGSRPRLGPRRHRAFLAPAADGGRQHPADPVLRRLPDLAQRRRLRRRCARRSPIRFVALVLSLVLFSGALPHAARHAGRSSRTMCMAKG